MVRLLDYRIRGYAGTRAPARKRAGAKKSSTHAANAEANGLPKSCSCLRARPFLAGAILRFQRLERARARGKAALYSSQSSEARIGKAPGGLGMEQLPPLSNWRGRKGRDRIALDGEEARKVRRLSHCAASRLDSEPALRFAIGRATLTSQSPQIPLGLPHVPADLLF